MPVAGMPLPSSRAEWLGARATLAGRRSVPAVLVAIVTLAAVLTAALIVPEFRGGATRATGARPHVDTLPLLARAEAARRASAASDSLYAAAVRSSAALAEAPPHDSATPRRMVNDSLRAFIATMDERLDRTAHGPLPRSYRALAWMLRGDPRISALVDSLNNVERKRDALGPVAVTDPAFAELTARLNGVGQTIREIGLRRRAELGAQLTALDTPRAALSTAMDTTRLRAARDTAFARFHDADSVMLDARMRNAAADSFDATMSGGAARQVPLLAVLITAVVLGAIVGFAFSLIAEIRRPRLANPREAERETASAVLAIVRDAERFPRFGGIDPFRMLYLGLTATGTRTRTVVMTGDNRDIVATIAGRLAFAAAADARATLVVDADTEGSRVAAFYGERPEPGSSDALAGVRLWREVTRPVGASDRLAIDVVCAGSIRRGELDRESRETARTEFARFRSEYDLCIIVAPTGSPFSTTCGLIDHPVAILCAELGRTLLERLRVTTADIRSAGAGLHGLTLWDAKLPEIS